MIETFILTLTFCIATPEMDEPDCATKTYDHKFDSKEACEFGGGLMNAQLGLVAFRADFPISWSTWDCHPPGEVS